MPFQLIFIGTSLLLLTATFLFRKRVASFSGVFLKITLAVIIGGFGGLALLSPLLPNSFSDSTLLIDIAVLVFGTLFAFMTLEVILKKPKDSLLWTNFTVKGLFNIVVLFLSFLLGIGVWFTVSRYRLPNVEPLFYFLIIVPLITIISIALIFLILRVVFKKIIKAIGININI